MRTLAIAMLLICCPVIHQTRASGQTKEFSVRGRVVDHRGRPVPGAEVVLEPEATTTTWEEKIVHHVTDPQGRFIISDTYLAASNIRLFVTSQPPEDTTVPIAPPFRRLWTRSEFAGVPVHLATNENVDLGDVPLQVTYGLVIFRLQGPKGEPLFTATTPDNRLPGVWVRVRDERGDLVGESVAYREAFRTDLSGVAVALPQGTWKAELAVGSESDGWTGPQRWTGSRSPLFVKASAGPLIEDIAFGKLQEHEVQPELGQKAEALRELSRLGFEFAVKAFIDRIERGNDRAVKLFLAAGMNPNSTDEIGRVPLLAAIWRGLPNVVEILLQSGANTSVKGSGGLTPLVAASALGEEGMVRILLSHGASVNVRTDMGDTALTMAAENQHLEIARVLLTAGANVNARTAGGITALGFAMKSGSADMIKVLKLAGAVE